MGFTDLRKKSEAGSSSIAIFIDTRKARKGPEFRLGSGLQYGTDYQLVRVKKWKVVGEPMSCAHDLRPGLRARPTGLHRWADVPGVPERR